MFQSKLVELVLCRLLEGFNTLVFMIFSLKLSAYDPFNYLFKHVIVNKLAVIDFLIYHS